MIWLKIMFTEINLKVALNAQLLKPRMTCLPSFPPYSHRRFVSTFYKSEHFYKSKTFNRLSLMQVHGDGGQPESGCDDARGGRHLQGRQGLGARSHHVRGDLLVQLMLCIQLKLECERSTECLGVQPGH